MKKGNFNMKIAVLGAGRMGTWFIRKLSAGNELFVYEPKTEALKNLPKETLILNGMAELELVNPELLLNCCPLGMTIAVFKEAMPYLQPSCILSDIASVKTGLQDFYNSSGLAFISTHPMFGPSYCDEANLKEQNAIIISESFPDAKMFWRSFYEGYGIKVSEEDFEAHDQTMAYSLATPFASTMVFAACMKRIDAPGTNFKKHLAIAHGLLAEDDTLISEVMFNPHTIRRLELINSQLAYLKHIINDRDHEEMAKYLARLRVKLDGEDPQYL